MRPKKQIDKFREAARELECDESEYIFDRKLLELTKKPKNNSENKPG